MAETRKIAFGSHCVAIACLLRPTTAMVRPCHVEEDHPYAQNRFCWCLSPLHIKTALPPIKFDVRNGDVVNLGEICNLHVHATLPLRRCQVLAASYIFLLGSY